MIIVTCSIFVDRFGMRLEQAQVDPREVAQLAVETLVAE